MNIESGMKIESKGSIWPKFTCKFDMPILKLKCLRVKQNCVAEYIKYPAYWLYAKRQKFPIQRRKRVPNNVDEFFLSLVQTKQKPYNHKIFFLIHQYL